jgi:DNA-binding transcriptional ArsR family regulator
VTETAEAESQAKIFASLSDPVRLRFVRALSGSQERTGSDLAAELGVSLALLCHHSKILVEAGVVAKRKEGQTTHYRVNRALLKECLRKVLAA